MEKPDSLIFDMDGTLWDPMELYVRSWNQGLKEAGISKVMTKEDLKPLMGVEGRKVLNLVLPGYRPELQDKVYERVNFYRRSFIAAGQGEIFEGVPEGLEKLSQKYKLFILSNCPAGIIQVFMKRAGITEWITDELAYGVNNMPKHHNMKLLSEKHHLISPVYIGDTDGDREQSEMAGLPFVFLSCGFGVTDRYSLKFDSFKSLTSYFLNL